MGCRLEQCEKCKDFYGDNDIVDGKCSNCRFYELECENSRLQKDLIRAEANLLELRKSKDRLDQIKRDCCCLDKNYWKKTQKACDDTGRGVRDLFPPWEWIYKLGEKLKQKPPPDIVPFEHLKDVSETIMEISESCTLLKFEELAKRLYKLANEVYQAAWCKCNDDDFESAIVWAIQTIDKLLLEDKPDIGDLRNFFYDTLRPNQDYAWFRDRLLKEWRKSIPIKNQTETQDV